MLGRYWLKGLPSMKSVSHQNNRSTWHLQPTTTEMIQTRTLTRMILYNKRLLQQLQRIPVKVVTVIFMMKIRIMVMIQSEDLNSPVECQ